MPYQIGAYDIYNGLIPEMRKEGHSLQAIGDACGGISRERVRQIINRFYPGTKPLLVTETQAKKVLGFDLFYLRKKNLITPTMIGTQAHRKWRFYDRAALEKAMLAFYSRSCAMCGKAVPLPRTYCPECGKERQRNYHPFRTPEQKRKHNIRTRLWQETHPEQNRILQRKAQRAQWERNSKEHYATTTYTVVKRSEVLPIGAKFQALGCRHHHLLLANGSEIPCICVKKC